MSDHEFSRLSRLKREGVASSADLAKLARLEARIGIVEIPSQQYDIQVMHLECLRRKVAQIQKKAESKGLTGGQPLILEDIGPHRLEHRENGATLRMTTVRLTGDTNHLSIKGHTLCGVVEYREAGNIVNLYATSKDRVPETLLQEFRQVPKTRCDQCDVKRGRTRGWIVFNDDTHKIAIVGTKCIEEYHKDALAALYVYKKDQELRAELRDHAQLDETPPEEVGVPLEYYFARCLQRKAENAYNLAWGWRPEPEEIAGTFEVIDALRQRLLDESGKPLKSLNRRDHNAAVILTEMRVQASHVEHARRLWQIYCQAGSPFVGNPGDNVTLDVELVGLHQWYNQKRGEDWYVVRLIDADGHNLTAFQPHWACKFEENKREYRVSCRIMRHEPEGKYDAATIIGYVKHR